MTVSRPYAQIYDSNHNSPIQTQLDNPLAEEFVTGAALNARSLVDAAGRVMRVGDQGVAPRGSKSIIWSSEGYNWNGITVPALTNAQKAASGSVATNINAAQPKGGISASTPLAFSYYRYLQLILVLSSFTGGTSPSIAFSLTFLDDAGTPNSLAIWNPAAATAAASYMVQVGPGMTVPPASAPTGYANAAVPSGWTVYSIPLLVAPNGNFSWTVTGAPTAVAWTACLYGQY